MTKIMYVNDSIQSQVKIYLNTKLNILYNHWDYKLWYNNNNDETQQQSKNDFKNNGKLNVMESLTNSLIKLITPVRLQIKLWWKLFRSVIIFCFLLFFLNMHSTCIDVLYIHMGIIYTDFYVRIQSLSIFIIIIAIVFWCVVY